MGMLNRPDPLWALPLCSMVETSQNLQRLRHCLADSQSLRNYRPQSLKKLTGLKWVE